MRKTQKKIALINDFSGFGRCSLTVSIPIISAMGIQCCPLPTAVLSNHTGYEQYFFDDYTQSMIPYYTQWEHLGLQFDGIYTGFLGSYEQVEIVLDFIRRFARPDTVVIVDPVMGDDGKTYDTLTPRLCRELVRLAQRADVLTPNVTEACILAGVPYRADLCSLQELQALAETLSGQKEKDIIITGVEQNGEIGTFIRRRSGDCEYFSQPLAGPRRAGTGDVFASVVAADAVCGRDLRDSVHKAAAFVADGIRLSEELQIPPQDGIAFEMLLSRLIPENAP